jgi:hypothetical protein
MNPLASGAAVADVGATSAVARPRGAMSPATVFVKSAEPAKRTDADKKIWRGVIIKNLRV